jgi:hypothetical protein
MNGMKTAHSRKGVFTKIGENLYRYTSSGVYYARYRNRGKEIHHRKFITVLTPLTVNLPNACSRRNSPKSTKLIWLWGK